MALNLSAFVERRGEASIPGGPGLAHVRATLPWGALNPTFRPPTSLPLALSPMSSEDRNALKNNEKINSTDFIFFKECTVPTHLNAIPDLYFPVVYYLCSDT